MPKPCLRRLANELCEEFFELADACPHLAVAVAVAPAGTVGPKAKSRVWHGNRLETLAPLKVWKQALGIGERGQRIPFSGQPVQIVATDRFADYVYYDIRGCSATGIDEEFVRQLQAARDQFEVLCDTASQYFGLDALSPFRREEVESIELEGQGVNWFVFAPECAVFELHARMMEELAETAASRAVRLQAANDPIIADILSSIDDLCWEVWIEWLALARRRTDEDTFESLIHSLAVLANAMGIDSTPLLDLDRWLAHHKVDRKTRPDSELTERVMVVLAKLEVEVEATAALGSTSDPRVAHMQRFPNRPKAPDKQSVVRDDEQPKPRQFADPRSVLAEFSESIRRDGPQRAAEQLRHAFLELSTEFPFLHSAIAWPLDRVRRPPLTRKWFSEWTVGTAADDQVWGLALGVGEYGPRLPLSAWWPEIDDEQVESVDYDLRGIPRGHVQRRRHAAQFRQAISLGDRLAADAADLLHLRWPTVVDTLAAPPANVVDSQGVVWAVRCLNMPLFEAYAKAVAMAADGRIIVPQDAAPTTAPLRDYSPPTIRDIANEWLEDTLFHRIGLGGRGALPDEAYFELTDTLALIAEKWGLDSMPIRRFHDLIGNARDLGPRHASLGFARLSEFKEAELVVERIATIARSMVEQIPVPRFARRRQDSTDVPVYLGEARYQCGDTIVQLEHTENLVLSKLVKQGAAKKSELEDVSPHAIRILKRIKRKEAYAALAPHIILPGGKGKGGYRTTIEPASPDVFR